MFKCTILVFVLCFTLSWTYPHPQEEQEPQELSIVRDKYGVTYLLVPSDDTLPRNRRETKAEHGSDGTYIEHKATVFNNENHQVNAEFWAKKNFEKDTPLTTGNKFDYQHKPSDSVFTLKTENTRGQGTRAQAEGTYNFFKTSDKKGTVGISGQYDRTYRAPWGTSKPDYGVFLRGTYNL